MHIILALTFIATVTSCSGYAVDTTLKVTTGDILLGGKSIGMEWNTLGCRYTAVKYIILLNTTIRWTYSRHRIHKRHLRPRLWWGVCCEDLEKNRPRLNGITLYNGDMLYNRPSQHRISRLSISHKASFNIAYDVVDKIPKAQYGWSLFCIITWLCDILALVWHFGPACVTFWPSRA